MNKRSKTRLQDRIAPAIGRDTYPEPAWEVLVAKGHVADYENGRISEEEFLGFARALAFYGELVEDAEEMPESNRKQQDMKPLSLGGYEEQRATTLAEYLKLRVAAHPEVLEWRKRAFDSTRPVSPKHAYEIVDKPAVREPMSGSWNPDNRESTLSGYLKFFNRESGEVVSIAFYEGSHFEYLHKLSIRLSDELFQWWDEAEAAWAIVTGKVREVPTCLAGEIDGFSNSHLTYATVNLKVEPWITAETVTRAYQHLQRVVLGRRPRAFSERNMTMTRFVMQRLREMITEGSDDEGALEMSWRAVMRSWNQEYPQWSYDDERQFYNDVHRIVGAVARPYDGIGSTSVDFTIFPGISIPEGNARRRSEDR